MGSCVAGRSLRLYPTLRYSAATVINLPGFPIQLYVSQVIIIRYPTSAAHEHGAGWRYWVPKIIHSFTFLSFALGSGQKSLGYDGVLMAGDRRYSRLGDNFHS